MNKNAFPEPNDVHWNGNHALINAMYNHSMVACSAMMLLMDDTGTTAVQKAEMEGLLTKMLMFSFSFCNVVMQPILNKLNILSNMFQQRSMDLLMAQSILINTIETFEEWRENFDAFWVKMIAIVQEKNSKLPDDDKIHLPADDEAYTGRRGPRS
jgi:hypothetical protein